MQESMYKYFKIGFVHFMAYPLAMKQGKPDADQALVNKDILESIEAACRDPYFTAIELMKIYDQATCQKVLALLEQSGMTVCYAAQPTVLSGANICSVDEATRQAAVRMLTEELALCRGMGSKNLALLSGKLEAGASYNVAFAACVKSLRELCFTAGQIGMGITLETFDTNVDKRALVGKSVEAARLVRQVCRPNFGLMVDLSHLPLLGYTDPMEALSPIKDCLVHVHVGNCFTADKDSPAYGDQHPRFGYLGSPVGVGQLAEFLRALFYIGYLGEGKQPVISFEVKPLPGESSDIVLANAKRTMNEAWALV